MKGSAGPVLIRVQHFIVLYLKNRVGIGLLYEGIFGAISLGQPVLVAPNFSFEPKFDKEGRYLLLRVRSTRGEATVVSVPIFETDLVPEPVASCTYSSQVCVASSGAAVETARSS